MAQPGHLPQGEINPIGLCLPFPILADHVRRCITAQFRTVSEGRVFYRYGMVNDDGQQALLTTTQELLALTPQGVEKFLSSRWVEGIGPVYARRIVDKFGTDALRIVRDETEKVEEIDGIGTARAAAAAESIARIGNSAATVAFLYSCGIGDLFIERILAKYKDEAEKVITGDPYAMVENVWQLSFFTADKIGRKLGIAADSPQRLCAALVTAVKHFAEEGHLFASPDEAVAQAASIASIDPDKVRGAIDTAVATGRLVESRGGLYLPVFYHAEKEGAAKIAALASVKVDEVSEEMIPLRSRAGHPYTKTQIEAIKDALNSPVMVLTGGPGTGKTTVLRGVIETLERNGKKVVLCAPTGRAAKRMTALTGAHASTIHSLLGYRQGEGYRTRAIDADVLIIDEGSMMEQVLFNHLLDALRPGTRVIIVGDADQLPAIGAGDVLRDMIDSGVITVARLDGNFRQEAGSRIATGARAINAGVMPDSFHDSDFMIVEAAGVKAIHDKIMELMTTTLPRAHGMAPTDILVVTPQQIGPLGARQLNADLQARLNPEGPALHRGTTIMRLGDPVMQTANSRERGIYNGETGIITAVDTEEGTLEVTFGDGRRSTYRQNELKELAPAYATTVHKLQGSEVRNIIFPVTMAHKPMLYRNLLYTGVSRATDLCILVGEPDAIRYAIGNTPSTRRNSNFKERLRHIAR